MKIYIIIVFFVIFIVIGYLTRFRAKNIFQGKEDLDTNWFPVQHHEEFHIGEHNIHAWFFDNDSDRIIIYCHGNYGNMSYYPHLPLLAKRLGISLLMFDYRGFGLTKGIPSTESIKEDGIIVYEWIKQYYNEDKIIVWGESLGGSIAAWIASCNHPSKLVLVSTFSDIHDVIRIHGKESYILHAVIALADILYDSLPIKEWIKKVNVPICIVHSLNDTYIPFECAVTNAQSSSYVKEFIPIKGDHTTPEMTPSDVERLQKFLEIPTPSFSDIFKDFMLVRENSPICKL